MVDKLEEMQAEITRLRGLLIDPGSPPWEDARGILVAELRKIGFDTHADNVAAGYGVMIPSYVALDLIAASRAPANGEQVDRDEMAKRLFWADTMLGENADRIQPEWRDRWWDELATMPLSGPGFLRKWRALAAAATLPTPTEGARERVKVLEEALAEAGRMSFAAASIPEGYIDGWADCVEHIRNAGVRAALVEARHEADTALGNKETDRHG